MAEAAEPSEERVWDTPQLKQLADATAKEYLLPIKKFDAVIECETAHTWDPKIQSGYVKHGKRENSWGLVQINLDAHPDISREQAQDPEFAVHYMAEEWKHGHQHAWSCY